MYIKGKGREYSGGGGGGGRGGKGKRYYVRIERLIFFFFFKELKPVFVQIIFPYFLLIPKRIIYFTKFKLLK